MNPYEPPQAGGERTNDSPRRKRLGAFALILAVVLVIGGVSTLSMMRAEQAEAEAMRIREAAKAASQGNPSDP